jgi:hypothetical protein
MFVRLSLWGPGGHEKVKDPVNRNDCANLDREPYARATVAIFRETPPLLIGREPSL